MQTIPINMTPIEQAIFAAAFIKWHNFDIKTRFDLASNEVLIFRLEPKEEA